MVGIAGDLTPATVPSDLRPQSPFASSVPPGKQAGMSFESQHPSILGQLPRWEIPGSQECSGTSEDRSRMSVRALAVLGLGACLEDDNWVPSAEFHSLGTCAKENKPSNGMEGKGA